MKRQRIALVANSTWNIYNFRLNIIRKFLDENWEVVVIAPVDQYIGYKERFPQVKHIPLRMLKRNNSNPLLDLLLIFELRRIYKKIQPDRIIHYTHKPNIYGGIASASTGAQSTAVITGLGYSFIHKGWTNAFMRMLYKLSNRFHRHVIFENKDDLTLFEKENLLAPGKGLAIKGCGVDTAIYLPYPNGQIRKKTIFTFIGRLLYDKGIVEFVQAARALKHKHSDLEFWITGELDRDNPSMLEKDTLLEWIDEGSIIYQGFVRDVRPIIAGSDCIVLPSYREGMPRTIMESMSMAKPVITTDTAGCRETVNEAQNGFLVKAQDAIALKTGMEKFLALSHEQRHEMGEKGRKMAIEQFNSEKIASELFQIISQN